MLRLTSFFCWASFSSAFLHRLPLPFYHNLWRLKQNLLIDEFTKYLPIQSVGSLILLHTTSSGQKRTFIFCPQKMCATEKITRRVWVLRAWSTGKSTTAWRRESRGENLAGMSRTLLYPRHRKCWRWRSGENCQIRKCGNDLFVLKDSYQVVERSIKKAGTDLY